MVTYFCGKDWVDVETNCHSACPSGSNTECKDPDHICLAFVEACKATMSPIGNSATDTVPNLSTSPVTSPPPSDPDSSLSLSSKGDDWESNEEQSDEEQSDEEQPVDKVSDEEQESLESDVEQPIDNAGEDWESDNQINNEGEDWGSDNQVNNEGEDWGSGNEVNNEGEDWGSDNEVNNEGESWDTPEPTATSEPTSPKAPTLKPTSDPTIDLISHLENLKASYFCSESWENIDCANAEECPSGDSKGKKSNIRSIL